ncbi:myocardin-related transcription factor B isoform X4 [Vombatus ursinus]|uniref:myocardin-related transcription factor B isoform X4 n=1 Tax=Vombatus ursinus TaxID=29139 RepID=UPI000FFCEF59|nr:myocardin-related transcription factor B isoform X4 [Vombatus ursinus]
MDHTGMVEPEDELGSLGHLAPSPQSEAVAHEFQELSLQSSQHLPPLNERKNGSIVLWESGFRSPLLTQSVSVAPLTMIDSSKKQQQGFPEILTAGDFEPLKEKECLEVNNQKSLKEVLQLRLQQRRTREQLVDQGIMPPLKSPAAFHEQIKSLERARTENFLKHKIRSRPDRSELVRMHILEETFAEPSLQATQMKLKRARLADDLNEKIAQRPGPMELVEKNILPVDSCVKEAIIGVGQEDYPHTQGDFSFDEDSSDALSPDQPASQESQGSAASPSEPKISESPSPATTNTPTQYTSLSTAVPEFLKTPQAADHPTSRPTAPVLSTSTVSSAKPGPALVKQSHPKNPNDKHRSKKCKDPKPRVKKLKYHQYIPPDQKGEKNEPPMDSNYARLLQQQQLFLQLQILSQQQQHYNYQTILPAPLKPLNDKHNSGNSALSNNAPTAVANTRQNAPIPVRKPGPLPSSLDDLKVAELKMELKLRGLPVSGTKTDLIERLKPYQELNSGISTSNAVAVSTSTVVISNPEVTMAFPAALNNSVASTIPSFKSETSSTGTSSVTHTETISSPLPISPSPSEHSSLSTDDTNMTDTFTEIMTMMSPSQFLSSSPLRVTNSEDSLSPACGGLSNMELDVAEKDRKLQEKEKQIEELKRKLEQEQKLVEVLKMQLEVEKRGQQPPPAAPQPTANSVNNVDPKHVIPAVKDENSLPDCSSSRQSVPGASHSLGQSGSTAGQNLVAKKAVVIKQEVPVAKADQQNIISQYYAPPQVGITTQPQVSAPVSPSGLAQTSHPKQDNFTQHVLNQSQQIRKVFPSSSPSNTVFSYQRPPVTTVQQAFINNTSSSVLQSRNTQVPSVQNGPSTTNKPGSPSRPQQFIIQHSVFGNTVTKTKDPPRYEEAIKQTRNIQSSSQSEISNAHSQQMDDLFDILIKSGEISLPIKEEPSPISKMRPVTANITTMPVNTVVSRPPPQVQMAPPISLEPINSLSISLENQLEAFLDGTLPSASEIPQLTSNNEDRESFSLIEDLQNDLLSHSGMLDHSHSPMETSEAQFAANNSCLSLDLPDSNLDNMEWLDITMPNSSSGLTPLNSATPSMFSTDFLDPQDLQLHWD